ncbi:MAG: hypothetical protein AB7F94_03860 [Nitrospira sp.]
MLTLTLHRTTGKCNSIDHQTITRYRVRRAVQRQAEMGWIWPYVFGTLVLAEANVWMSD